MKKFFMMIIFVIACIVVVKPVDAYASSAFNGKTLDYGIYWYGKGDVCEKDIQGVQNPYFNPNKPTVILLHGWQKDSTKSLHRISFNSKNNCAAIGLDMNLADYWINKGWNIGIFYWNQFGDESEVRNAEAKVWNNTSNVGLRWRKVDGSYSNYTGPEKSVAEIFVKEYSRVMRNYRGSEIRFIGHSLGNQLATNSAKLIQDGIERGSIPYKLQPNRVAILDPFWSKGGRDYLNGKWTGELCRQYINELKQKGIAFEMYKSSNINDLLVGDANEELRKMVTYTEIYPDFLPFSEQMTKHSYCKEWYMYSMAFDAPKLNSGQEVAISAATPTYIVRNNMGIGKYFYQVNGKKTITPQDDTFSKVNF